MPKIVKIPLIALAVLIALLLVLLGIMQTSAFKNYAVDKATIYLSKELKTEVSIGEIDIDYFDRLKAKNVLVKDLQNDSLFFIKEVRANYNLRTCSKQAIVLDNVEIDGALVSIGIPKGKTQLNLQFLIDYFTPDSINPNSKGQLLAFKKASLNNSSFRYFNENLGVPKSRSFNENDFTFSNINTSLSNLEILKDSLSMVVNHLSGKETCGFDVNELKGDLIISRSTLQFDDLLIATPKSRLSRNLKFNYNSYLDYAEFIDSVEIIASISDASVHTDDLAFFSSDLKKYNELISGEANISGTVRNLNGEKLNLLLGDHTRYIGSAKIKGLPEVYESLYDLRIQSFTSDPSSISKLIELDPVPSEFNNIGNFKYAGTFKGTLKNFVTTGDIETEAGRANVDLNLENNETLAYEAKLTTGGLDLNRILGKTEYGDVIGDFTVVGSGVDLATVNAKIEGRIDAATYGGYNYQNIVVDGVFAEEVFSGEINLNDPNYKLNLKGKINAKNDIPKIDISTSVASVNLRTLGIQSENAYVSFTGDIKLEGSSIDDITGQIDLNKFKLKSSDQITSLTKLKIKSLVKKDSTRDYVIDSEIGKASLSGDFKLSESELLVSHILHAINPVAYPSTEEMSSKFFILTAELIGGHEIYNEYLPGLIFDSAHLNLSYNEQSGKIDSKNKLFKPIYNDLNSPWITFNLKNAGLNTPINYAVNTNGLNQVDSVLFDKLNANGFIENGTTNFEITGLQDTILDIVLAGRYYYVNDSSKVFLDDSKLEIFGKTWDLQRTSFPNIINANGVTEFRYLDFRSKGEILFVDASVGTNADKLNLILSDFTLENLSPFLAGYDVNLKGLANGFIDVSNRDGYPIIESDLVVDDLSMDNDTLGNLILNSAATDEPLLVTIDGRMEGGLLNDLNISGDINFKNKNSPLNLNLKTDKSSIKPFEKYLVDLASQLSGYSTTNVAITGKLNAPILSGEMLLEELDFVVDYLQTNYKGNAVLEIDYNSFDIKQAILKDRNNRTAIVSGGISHKNFSNFLFDIGIDELDGFEIMNTVRADNDLFYGTAYVDGEVGISGPMDDILLKINAKSRKGTKINIPLDNFETSGNLSYVEFVDLRKDVNQLENTINTVAGVEMDFNFEVTNDAEVSLIFDELLGDKIDAAGHGNLRMEVNTFGDFNMYGGLTIDRGNYLFTAYDLINKYFIVTPGGTLFWDGNPYNATVDINASKREYPVPKTLLEGVISPEDAALYSDAIPVDCHLQLSGLLFNPEVEFDISFPTQSSIGQTDATVLNTVVERIKSDPEELNRQVFALLVLGSFVPPSFATAGNTNFGAADGLVNTGVNSLSDFASSQLNNWISQLDSRLQVGFDYQGINRLDPEDRAELILSLKRKFLNDRLELAASVDAAANNSEVPYDFSVQYNLNPDGTFKVRGFQKNANDPTLGNANFVSTTGVGLFYRYQFDRFFKRKKKKRKADKEIATSTENP